MSLKVLVVPDKFKGTLNAPAAAAAIVRGWRRERPQDRLKPLPMSDGGDGFGTVMSRLLGAKPRSVLTVDAAHRPCSARWWWQEREKVAIIETAQVIGLAMLPPGRFHPFELDTLGLGTVLQEAASKGARMILMGIGGSATNDAGFGLARALGWRFLDTHGQEIVQWTDLGNLREIRRPVQPVRAADVIIAVDVKNPLLGRRGATRVYGPQKGLRPSDFRRAERSLRRLSAVRDRSGSLAREPGAGAAGGLGFGLRAFVGARLEPGFELFARVARLDAHLDWADLVITGEGAIDRSTLMGKGVGEIARKCRRLGIPCLGLAGLVDLAANRRTAFKRAAALTDLTSARKAKQAPGIWLERLAREIARECRGEQNR